MTKQIINQWKWKAKVKSQSISVEMDGTAQAVNIQEATNKVKRNIASQLGVKEEMVVVYKMHQVGAVA